jgi:hypothetical protein
MKKFWVALIAVAVVAGFALSASAADVKFSGSYYATGLYADNWGLKDDESAGGVYAQRLRVATAFKIAEGLTLNTRFDALEGRWGQYGYMGTAVDRQGQTPGADQKDADDNNIAFDRAWVSFAVPFGQFDVGRQAQNEWGTRFASDSFDAEAIRFSTKNGPWEVGAFYEKQIEAYGAEDYDNVVSDGGVNDGDRDNYGVYGKYKWDGGLAGLQIQFMNDATENFANLNGNGDYKAKVWTFSPYMQATFGPVFVEAEINYAYGEAESELNWDDMDIRAWNAFIHAKGNIGPAYVGAFYAYVSGDDPDSDEEIEGSNFFGASGYRSGLPTGGASFDPCLILWNSVNNKWLGKSSSSATSLGTDHETGAVMENAHLFQIYGGFKPIPKLDVKARLSYAMADEKPDNYDDDEYGTEFDLTAAYKIYDNLTYTVGFGYLWAGDIYKGATDNDVDDTYLLMHRLDLSF